MLSLIFFPAFSTTVASDPVTPQGLVLQIGAYDAESAADAKRVEVLLSDASATESLRRKLDASGDLGRVSVITHTDPNRLPYNANSVNRIELRGDARVERPEIMRVLTPEGELAMHDHSIRKPRPKTIDDWTHYLHSASGNAVAHDDEVGPPRHLQWLAGPRWSRHHDRMASMSALISSRGRLFYIMDEGSRVSIQLPARWNLVARDGFNGVTLWKKPIPTWFSHLWPLKSGPTQLARRLVTDGERIYVTLGLKAPLSALDPATGELQHTFENTKTTEEVITSEGKVFLVVNRGPSELDGFKPKLNTGDQARVRKEYNWDDRPRELMAFEAGGKHLWTFKSPIAPICTAAGQGKVVMYDGRKLICLNQNSGDIAWTGPPAGRRSAITMNFGPKIVIYQDLVYYAGGDRKMIACNLATGKQVWDAPHPSSGYQSPEDLLVAGGLVWCAPTTSGRDSGEFVGRDPKTGEARIRFPPNVTTYWFHHRCYIAKATDKYIMPSRTGIEFVDPATKTWDIHHWVRGGCLYGVLPSNGLTYAPPHNCACYPEAKLFGFNALAPAQEKRLPEKEIEPEDRLTRGPAFGKVEIVPAVDSDWPTYRGSNHRNGWNPNPLPSSLTAAWQAHAGTALSPLTAAAGQVFVSQPERHAVVALNATTGKVTWRYLAGGRVDSPPTYADGALYFGCSDGTVTCLRASDGKLVWRFIAAPHQQRTVAFEQVESLWPVHGSVLIEDGKAYFVAGRSNYLDGGLRFYQLQATSGKILASEVIDDIDPANGENLQNRIQTLQMPAGLTDILSSDGVNIYMRSQVFSKEGSRIEIGPHSGDPAVHAGVQRGPTAHLFSPTGFLDASWFHRSYWVYGRSFAGGHNGYHQAGKFTPAGRILVADDKRVFGYGRKPQYYKWTTTLEHQLFAASKEPPPEALSQAPATPAERRGTKKTPAKAVTSPAIVFPKAPHLNPQGKALTVEAWVKPEKPDGVVVAHGGPTEGYGIILRRGRPRFIVRSKDKPLAVAVARQPIDRSQWTHLVGVLDADKSIRLYVNGNVAAQAKIESLLVTDPVQELEIGADSKGPVGEYSSPFAYSGLIDEVKIWHRALTVEEITKGAKENEALAAACSFDAGRATDRSRHEHDAQAGAAVKRAAGKLGDGIRLAATKGKPSGRYHVEHDWTQDIPIYVRAMLLADDILFIAGPADVVNEEETFAKLTQGDKDVEGLLERQEKILTGAEGCTLHAVNTADGTSLATWELPSTPVWDGMAAAGNRLFISLEDGSVHCLAAE